MPWISKSIFVRLAPSTRSNLGRISSLRLTNFLEFKVYSGSRACQLQQLRFLCISGISWDYNRYNINFIEGYCSKTAMFFDKK